MMFARTTMQAAVSAACGGLALASSPALAQQQLERVEITGSSLRRVDAETALPVTVITVEELKKSGVTTAEQAMQRIAANQSNFGISAAIGATTGAKAEADLRGLSGPIGSNSNKTLVLLNGRRLANHPFDSAAVDLNAIPLSAVSRIEVLRDGASAIYGTDAIGGVVNFILRRDYQGLEVSAETQRPERGSAGSTDRFSLTAGFGSLTDQRFNVLASIDWRKQKVLEAARRSFSKTGILGSGPAAIIAGTSGTSFPGDLNGFEPTQPNCAPPGSVPVTDPTNGVFQCRYDFSRDVDLIPQNEQVTALVRGTLAITPEHTASIELLHANNKATQRVAAAPTSNVMPASSPFFPAGAPLTAGGIPDPNDPTGATLVPGGVANWRQIPAGKRTAGDNTTNQRAQVELQGPLVGWDYRAAVGNARGKSTATVKRGFVNDDLIQQGVFDGVINPFGEQTAAGLAAIDAAQVVADTVIGKADIRYADFRISTDVAQLSAGPLALALGVEHRREKSSFENTDITAQLGSLGVDADGDTSGSRNVSALFAELNIPVMKNLDLTLAARYDKYSDFGNTTNPKIGLRWQPVKQVLVRGSFNTGFRAPTLYEIYQPRSLTFTTDNYDDPLLCPGGTPAGGASAGVVCGQQVLQRQSGPVGIGQSTSALKPEKSRTATLGFVFEPVSAVTLGIDFWRIKIKDIVNGLPEQAVFGDPTKYASRFVRCSALSPAERAPIDACLNFPSFDPIAYIDVPNENLGELKTTGIDLSASFRSGATPFGNFTLTADGTYIAKYEYQRERGGAFIDALGRYSDNAPVFRWQHVITAGWSAGPWGASLSQRFKSGYTDQGGATRVGSYEIYDASLSYAGVKNLTLIAGVKNLLDRDPPTTVQVTTFQRGYDPRFTDPLGRTFLARAEYKFF